MEVCREKNTSDVTFHRWRQQFGHMNLNVARRLKELELENTELKKMLADAMRAKNVLEYALEKNVSPARKKPVVAAAVQAGVCSGRAGCRTLGLSRSGYAYQAGRRSSRLQELV